MNLDIITVGLSIYGIKEVPGAGDNPFILKMASDCGFTNYTHDSIAWCSLAGNWVAMKAGYERSKSLAARSWLNVGTPVDVPEPGDAVILWRDSPQSWQGHFAFFINSVSNYDYLMGGNQGDMFNIEAFTKDRVLGYRRLAKI